MTDPKHEAGGPLPEELRDRVEALIGSGRGAETWAILRRRFAMPLTLRVNASVLPGFTASEGALYQRGRQDVFDEIDHFLRIGEMEVQQKGTE